MGNVLVISAKQMRTVADYCINSNIELIHWTDLASCKEAVIETAAICLISTRYWHEYSYVLRTGPFNQMT